MKEKNIISNIKRKNKSNGIAVITLILIIVGILILAGISIVLIFMQGRISNNINNTKEIEKEIVAENQKENEIKTKKESIETKEKGKVKESAEEKLMNITGFELGTNNTKAGSDWKVMGMDPENKENVLLAMDPVGNVKLFGKSDWVNCQKILDEACGIYSVTIDDNTYKARSMNESDMLMLSGYDPTQYRFYGIKLKDLTFWDTILSNGNYTRDEKEELGNYTNDYYKFGENDIEVSTTAKNLLFGNGKGWFHWVASPFVSADSKCVTFGVRIVGDRYVFTNGLSKSLKEYEYDENLALAWRVRPVVSIPFSVLK